MSRVVMFVYNDVTHDSRVLREAATLRDAGHEVTIMARPPDTPDRVSDSLERDGIRIVRLPVPQEWHRWWRVVRLPLRVGYAAQARLLGRKRRRGDLGPIGWLVSWRFAVIGWGHRAADQAPIADVYHGHDLSGAVAAERAAARHGGRLVYDSHELQLESRGTAHQPAWARRILRRLEARIVARADATVTVNSAIAVEISARYRPTRVVVVHNCPPRREVGPPPIGPDPLRAATGIPSGTDVILYHGGLFADRGVEQLIDAVGKTGSAGAHLVFLGYGSLRHEIAARAADPASAGRVHLLDPVLPSVLLEWVAGADVDAMPIQPTTLNHRLSTPNKLFESLAAGVPVVVSDFAGMRSIVIDDPDGPLGAVCDPTDPDAIAAAIGGILALDRRARADLRARCLRAAHERWNWETEAAKLVSLYVDLAARHPPTSRTTSR